MGCGGGGGLNAIGNAMSLGLVPDITGSTAASNAADAQIAAGQQANQTQLDIYNKNTANAQPYMDAGRTSLGQLQGSMGDLTRKFGAGDFQQDPGYQFALNQGMQAIQRSAAAKGSLNSTGTMQDLNNYAQGMASQQYQNAYDRFTQNQQQRYNMLSGQAGMGQASMSALAGVGENYANQVGSNMLGMGNARSAADMQQSKFMNSLIQGGTTMAAASMGAPVRPPQQQQQMGGYSGVDNYSNMSAIA